MAFRTPGAHAAVNTTRRLLGLRRRLVREQYVGASAERMPARSGSRVGILEHRRSFAATQDVVARRAQRRRGGLDPHHLGPEAGEEKPGVGGREPRRALDDANLSEWASRAHLSEKTPAVSGLSTG